ncbi:MAG: SUMF1/EgtB/PvdO family nonheme iron enzyme, partial [Cyanobacteriota bacterium]|nr:SUMF1/EgtB/PvdO family nonheme iron enzyme [Cyanobacteriota bacterium]
APSAPADAPRATQTPQPAAQANRQEQLDANEDRQRGDRKLREISIGDSGGAEHPEQQLVKTSNDIDPRSQKLAAIKERLERKDAERQRRRGRDIGPEQATSADEADNHPLIQIPATKGWLVREGSQWQKREAPITVPGFLEELAEGIAITMIQIPAGEFLMGAPESEEGRTDNDGPQHRVKLPSFFIGQTPVTQAQWRVVASWPKVERDLNPDPSHFEGANRPVEQVSRWDAMEFCRRLSQRTNREYSLPSEAQWEYACRAGTRTPFAFGETLTPDLANYDGNVSYGTGPKGTYLQETSEVSSFPANSWGVQDMHGNVWEWALDTWHDNYKEAPTDGTPWRSVGGQGEKLLRGGSWGSPPEDCGSAARIGHLKGDRSFFIGFRLCVPPPGRSS